MKNLIKVLFASIIVSLVLTSCTGPAGEDGQDAAPQVFTAVFEIEGVDFVSNNNFDATISVTIDERIEVLDSDIINVFVVNPVKTADNGGIEVWEPLPSITNFDDGGYAEYSFDFALNQQNNIFDVEITLESNDFSALGTGFTDNQIFRIAVIPTVNIDSFSSSAKIIEQMESSEVIKLD